LKIFQIFTNVLIPQNLINSFNIAFQVQNVQEIVYGVNSSTSKILN